MRRRTFIAGLAGTLAQSTLTQAQQVQESPTIGFLHPGFPDSGMTVFDALRDGLRDVGYVEGETIKVEVRWARGRPEILLQLAREPPHPRAAFPEAAPRPWEEAEMAQKKKTPII